MSRRRILGALLLVAGICVSWWTLRSIAWMVYGGARDFVQLGLLVSGLGAAGGGLRLLCGRGGPGPAKLPGGGGGA